MADNSLLLPDYVGGSNNNTGGDRLGRARASTLNDAQPNRAVMTATAQDEPIPIPWGEVRVAGDIIAGPALDGSGNFVVGVGWGEGEIAGVQSIYINGADMPAGVTATHYNGTSGQGIDPTLDAVLPGYGDTFENAAYSVFVIPTGTVDGFPGQHTFEAVLQGRLLYDERDGTTSYSRNGGLVIGDAITNILGRTAYGVTAVADRCDELASDGLPRVQVDILIDSPLEEPALLDLLAAHAECIWDWDGEGVRLVPDAPVDTPAAVLTASDVRGLRMPGKSMANSPTVVEVTYTKTTADATAWSTDTVRDAEPGVETGEVREEISNVRMRGTTRKTEAQRKGRLRRRQLRYPVDYTWTGRDPGIKLLRGDVVQLPNIMGLVDQWVRIVSKKQTGLGLYEFGAEHYSASAYADDIEPGDTVAIPEGAIGPTLLSAAPSGWALFTDADGRLLRAAGTGTNHGDTGGDNTVTVAGDTTPAGAHSAEQDAIVVDWDNINDTPSTYRSTNTDAPDHQHSYNTTAEVEPSWRANRLLIKTGGSGTLPENVGCWADGVLNNPALAEHLSHVGRLVKAGAPASGGSPWALDAPIPLTTAGKHPHWGSQTWRMESGVTFSHPLHELQEAGNHNHPGSVAKLQFDLARTTLAQYFATEDGVEGGTGQIYGYALDPANLDGTGWNIMDGTKGTRDMSHKFIELSSADNAGQNKGANTGVSWDNNTEYDGEHDHEKSTTSGNTQPSQTAGHIGTQNNHRHGVSGSDPNWVPEHFVIRLIQYTGVV